MFETLDIKSSKRIEMINITSNLTQIINKYGIKNGICLLHVPHTTAAITVNENASPDVVHDIIDKTARLIPGQDNFTHTEGNSDAHIKSSLFGPTLSLIIEKGEVMLGVWQSIYFCEFDGPRNRKLYIKVIKEL